MIYAPNKTSFVPGDWVMVLSPDKTYGVRAGHFIQRNDDGTSKINCMHNAATIFDHGRYVATWNQWDYPSDRIMQLKEFQDATLELHAQMERDRQKERDRVRQIQGEQNAIV